MRIPQPRTQVRTMAQPSKTYVAGGNPAPQPGKASRKPGVAGKPMKMGHEMYLWILVLIEVALIGGFRKYFRRFHGG